MTNVRRHTNATAIKVMIDVSDAEVSLRVRNDHGSGPCPSTLFQRRFSKRTAAAGGTVRVCHERDFTEIEVRLPALGD